METCTQNYFKINDDQKIYGGLKNQNDIKNEDPLKIKDDLRIEDALKFEDELKIENDLKIEDSFKNEDNLKFVLNGYILWEQGENSDLQAGIWFGSVARSPIITFLQPPMV